MSSFRTYDEWFPKMVRQIYVPTVVYERPTCSASSPTLGLFIALVRGVASHFGFHLYFPGDCSPVNILLREVPQPIFKD